MDARLSRYSYLVSLLPRQVMTDLDLGMNTWMSEAFPYPEYLDLDVYASGERAPAIQ